MANKNMTYREAAHAMQSGVALDQSTGSQCGHPKHLRVGVNSALVDSASLAKLLVKKGLISEEEYAEAIRVGMIEEVERYERVLSKKTGKEITLG